MFTIVIPLYNKILSVANTIESVLKQSCPDFELLIINDGSTDGSEKVALGFSDPRIVYLSQENKGLSATRNEGILHAKYDLITVLDADDILHPDFLQKMKDLIDEFPGCAVYSAAYDIQRKGKLIKANYKLPFKHRGIVEDYFYWQLKNAADLVWTCVSVVRREAFIKAGMYDVRLNRGEDLDMWYRIFPDGKLAFLNESLAIYGDSDDDRMTAPKNLKAESDLVFHFGKFAEKEKKDPGFKLFLDKYRLKYLRAYYIEGTELRKVKDIVGEVNMNAHNLISMLIYKVIPRPLLIQPYRFFKKIKSFVA